MIKIVLFEEKKECCGCSACMNICPKGAISMRPDEYRFIYPEIDKEKCIECGLCKIVCGFQRDIRKVKNVSTWLAVNKEDNMLLKSASGGVFSSIASEVLIDGGIVFGCAILMEGESLTPKHIAITKTEDLYKLQGSKYVQSFIGTSYKQAKKALDENRKVLFSGTPCQIAGLYAFLGNKEYNNLFTIDIICHGVPSAEFFQDYLHELEKKKNKKITSFLFRDKQKGWGLLASATFTDKNGISKKNLIDSRISSYYNLFLSSKTYRINCYTCPFAGLDRPGNISIGDFWGIEKQHPEYLDGSIAKVDVRKGISCILVNNHKGTELIKVYGNNLLLLPSTVEKAAEYNGQLNAPSTYSPDREIIMQLYKDQGYSGVDVWHKHSLGVRYPIFMLWSVLPNSVKKYIKKVIKH